MHFLTSDFLGEAGVIAFKIEGKLIPVLNTHA
jgi:hypothetical protein